MTALNCLVRISDKGRKCGHYDRPDSEYLYEAYLLSKLELKEKEIFSRLFRAVFLKLCTVRVLQMCIEFLRVRNFPLVFQSNNFLGIFLKKLYITRHFCAILLTKIETEHITLVFKLQTSMYTTLVFVINILLSQSYSSN